MQSHSNSIQCWWATNFIKLNSTKRRVIHSAKKKKKTLATICEHYHGNGGRGGTRTQAAVPSLPMFTCSSLSITATNVITTLDIFNSNRNKYISTKYLPCHHNSPKINDEARINQLRFLAGQSTQINIIIILLHLNFPESKMLLHHVVFLPQLPLRSIIENNLVFVHLRSLMYACGTGLRLWQLCGCMIKPFALNTTCSHARGIKV